MPSLGRSESLRDKEEVLAPMRIKELHHEARRHKSSTGVGTNGFHPKLPLDLTEGCTFSRKCKSAGFGKNRQAPRCSSWFQRTSPARADCFVVHFDSVVGVDESAVGSRVEIEMEDQVGRDMRPQWRSRENGLGSIVGNREARRQGRRVGCRCGPRKCVPLRKRLRGFG